MGCPANADGSDPWSPLDSPGISFLLRHTGLSLLIKHVILAIRLLANMFAGHLVLGVILAFIPLFVHQALWFGVAPAAVLGATGLNLLELLVAFLQAYVFAFLTALFIGMSVHQH